MMPWCEAEGILMLSTPVPARPIIFKFFAALMTSSVTLVADRTIKP